MSDMIVVDGMVAMQRGRLLRVASSLAFEVLHSGARHSGGSIMLLAAELCGSNKRTKRGVLKEYMAWLPSQIPGYEVNNPIIRKALDK